MAPQRGMLVAGYVLAFLIAELPIGKTPGQSIPDEPTLTFSRAESLGLSAAKTSELKQKLESADYTAAERLLLTEIDQDPHSLHAATLLAFIGGVFYLNHDYFHAAVAWNKSQAIAPLPVALKFSLAMTYIRMDRADWAREVLAGLAEESPQDAIYPYWLGRLDYASHSYADAVTHFKRAIALAPGMARAYDNLGLCYYQQNQNTLAVKSYQKAIDLDRSNPHPSAWPYLNLAVTLQLLNLPREAEADLREAIRLDPEFAQAHFQLGNVLEHMDEPRAAIDEFRAAANFDAGYAEPHFALARIYRKLGDESAARKEVKIYLRLHNLSATSSSTPQNPLP